MAGKNDVLIAARKFLAKNGTVTYRVCKLLKDGDFETLVSSHELAHMLNEGSGKKIKANNLTALMEPLLKEDVVKVKIAGKGRNKRKFWYPGWLGRKDLDKLVLKDGSNTLFFTGSEAWSDPNKNFPKMIEILEGDLCIVDPFFGIGTFYVLEKFGKNRKIRFLTSNLGREEQNDLTKFQTHLRKFRKEFKKIEIKKHRGFDLHDRYIIADNALVVVGHGFKDMAEDRESFVVFLPKILVTKFLPSLKQKFEERWKKSDNLT